MLEKITENVEIHQTLPDTPNLTSEELKKEWDKGNKIIKEKFNELIDSLNDAEVLELKEKIEGTVLYENSDGISSGSFNLTDDISNYKRLVFYDEGQKVGEMEVSETDVVNLGKTYQGSINLFIWSCNLSRSNNTFTFGQQFRNYFDGNSWYRDTQNGVGVRKVIGYKY